MKQKWSREWVSSVQPRKQRKYRYNAPLHVRQKLVSSHLSETLRKRYNKRSMPVRKGDEVMVVRGTFKGKRGIVDRVDLSKLKVYVDEVKVKKVDGSEVMRPLDPSNLIITKLNLDDKRRQKIIERSGTAIEEKKETETKEKTQQKSASETKKKEAKAQKTKKKTEKPKAKGEKK